MPSSKPQTLFPDHSFKISIPDLDIGFFRDCSGLSLEFDVFEWAEGGNNEFVWNLPGRARYPHLTLGRGMTEQDALQKWVWQTRLQPQLKELTVELISLDARTTRSWVFSDAFPVRWTGPHLDASGRAMATESLDIVHSGLKVA
ncbi:MAG TPA: phage tail protein [Solirubrobacteraceae bacterium]|jgi:phage tail-like protein